MNRIRNECIRGRAGVVRGDEVSEARLRWAGHMKGRDSQNSGGRMLEMELPDRTLAEQKRKSCIFYSYSPVHNPICG